MHRAVAPAHDDQSIITTSIPETMSTGLVSTGTVALGQCRPSACQKLGTESTTAVTRARLRTLALDIPGQITADAPAPQPQRRASQDLVDAKIISGAQTRWKVVGFPCGDGRLAHGRRIGGEESEHR